MSASTSGTDWARVDALTDAEIDFSDVPEITPEMFARAIVRKRMQPATRELQGISIDAERRNVRAGRAKLGGRGTKGP